MKVLQIDGNENGTLSMIQGTLYKEMGRTGGIVKLDIEPQDKIPESEELENKEEIIKKGYYRVALDPNAPNYVENIITSKFYRVDTAPKLVTVEKEPEYESADQIYENDVLTYLHLLKQLSVNTIIFLGGIIAGIGLLHFYVLFFATTNEDFMAMYTKISKGVESIYHMFCFICTILALFLMSLSHSSYTKSKRKLSNKAGGHMLHFIFYLIAFICISF